MHSVFRVARGVVVVERKSCVCSRRAGGSLACPQTPRVFSETLESVTGYGIFPAKASKKESVSRCRLRFKIKMVPKVMIR